MKKLYTNLFIAQFCIIHSLILSGGIFNNSPSISSSSITHFTLTKKTQLVIAKGNIVKCQNMGAIVNPANPGLWGGGGACGAIFNAAGWDNLQDACNAINNGNGINFGQACITGSFNLKNQGIKYIIHAAGPDCGVITDPQEQNRLLAETYTNSLKIADQNKLTSIAFPFISAGIYGFPRQLAAQIALKTVAIYLKNNPSTRLKKVFFILFSDTDTQLFCSTAQTLSL